MSVEEKIIAEIKELTVKLENDNNNLDILIERTKLYLKLEKRDLALNDLLRIIEIEPDHIEANSYILLVKSINDYFYNQTYNV